VVHDPLLHGTLHHLAVLADLTRDEIPRHRVRGIGMHRCFEMAGDLVVIPRRFEELNEIAGGTIGAVILRVVIGFLKKAA